LSDGTLRAFAALVAIFQTLPPFGSPSLIGIEEPETALHPAALRALLDAFDEATLHTIRAGKNGGGDPWQTDGDVWVCILILR
jgi:hypothetical protein